MTSNRRTSLTGRCFLAMVLVAMVGAGTAAIVGLATAPGLFHRHLHEAMPSVSTTMVEHADHAFWSANALGAAFALPAALLASTAASYYLSRRLRRSAQPLAHAAAEVAGGRYDVRVHADGLGPEFDELIEAFNHMAARLRRSEESRRRLLADVTHELRTPVATLNAYIEGLEDGIATLDAETSIILRAQTARLTRLTDDMAAVSIVDEQALSFKICRAAPQDLVQSAVTAFADRYTHKGVVLVVAVAPGIPCVDVDPDRIGQVLGNLLDNALRHTARGGRVTISARADDGDVQFAVEDTGDGIAATDLELVFDRFYRVDTARNRADGSGSGIGLAITRSLVEAHGGRIRGHSDGLGHGSTFTINLPAAR